MPRYYTLDQRGLDTEQAVLDFWRGLGLAARPSCKRDNIKHDIDVYVADVAVSVKAEHAGVRYGHVYVELATEIPNGQEWSDDGRALAERLTGSKLGGYWPGWFFSGQATMYAIVQASDLLLYGKSQLRKHLERGGCVHTRGLSRKVRATQTGRDTICAYMNRAELQPYRRWVLPEAAIAA